MEDIDLDAGQINITRAITANGTFKVPKTGKPRAVLLMPPAAEACRVLLSLVADHPVRSIEVYQNRHESRKESVTPLLSPSTQARKKIINVWYVPTAWNTKWGRSRSAPASVRAGHIRLATLTPAGALLPRVILRS